MGITIHVQDSRTNNFAVGKKVVISDSVGRRDATTNSSGDAIFAMAKSGNYKVFVDNRQVHDGPIVGVQIVYI